MRNKVLDYVYFKFWSSIFNLRITQLKLTRFLNSDEKLRKMGDLRKFTQQKNSDKNNPKNENNEEEISGNLLYIVKPDGKIVYFR